MLENKAYANIFQDFLRSVAFIAPDIKEPIGNSQQSDGLTGSIEEFNLLELPALMCDTYRSMDMLQVLLSNLCFIQEDQLFNII